MRVLVLGGTVFLGRHLVEVLISRGHCVTLYNRGQYDPDVFDGIEKLCGDRNLDLSPLDGRSWDIVVDTCGYFPHQVEASAKKLYPRTPRYIYISSVNQYSDLSKSGTSENLPQAKSNLLNGVKFQSLTAENYGPLKASCEEVIRTVYGDSALVVRPGCLVGPYDQAHRFTYWVNRMAAGGEVMVPGRPDQLWQIIDVRDVAGWIVRMIEVGQSGTFNLVGPANPISAELLMQEMSSVLNSNLQVTWVDTHFLRTSESGRRFLDLAEWSDLPKSMSHLYSIDNSKAQSFGLTFRLLSETIREVFMWLEASSSCNIDKILQDAERKFLQEWKSYVRPIE